MKDFITNTEKYYQVLAPGSWGDPDNKQRQAIQKFNELLLRLEYRYHELLLSENNFRDWEKKDLNELQLRLLDKTEAFHQHLYATFSGFVMLLNFILTSDEKMDMPTRSIRSFISFLHTKLNLPENYYKSLSLARDFRSFTDHIQTSKLHDWMTMGIEGGPFGPQIVIVYFVRKSRSVFAPDPEHMNPFDESFSPPVDHEGFKVSPPYKETYKYFKEMINFILGKFTDQRKTNNIP